MRAAIASEQPLEIIGHGTKRAIGQPMATNALLDLSALNAVTAYEPNELIITVQAGAPLADVLSLIDSKNQQFAFEPMDTSALLGTPRHRHHRRHDRRRASPVRAASRPAARAIICSARMRCPGFGDSFKAGGRVVKNVTGYDLCKLLAGSWGTLAVMTEVTLKVMPRPESERTLVLRGLDDVAANRAMTAALGSPFDVSGAAHLPDSAFRAGGGRAGRARLAAAGGHAAAAGGHHGLGGRIARRRLARAAGAVRRGRDPRGCGLGGDLDVRSATSTPFAAGGPLGAWPVWRIVCPPASGGALGQALARDTGGDVIYDWGGGLIWAALPPQAGCRRRRCCAQRVDAVGGHATLIRASEQVRRDVDVFHPQAGGLAALERARPPQLRSEEHPQSRPDDRGGSCDMKTEFTPRPARRSRYRGSRQDPARLRALRLLHRDLSDLCAARRRTR